MRQGLWLYSFVLAAACSSAPSAPDAPSLDSMAAADAGNVIVPDGTPMRRPCTSNFGDVITPVFGRLDGLLVAIVDPGSGPCNADSDHVHLQVLANGKTYDVAVNVDGRATVGTTTMAAPLTGSAWEQGWHTGFSISYPGFDKHTADFVEPTKSQLVAMLKAELANVNHISVYSIGYGPDGTHLVHYNGNNRDGAIVTQPLSRPAQWRMFRFADQAF